jgi:hypothetical protein
MTKGADQMMFRSPAGERVFHSVVLMARNLESIQRELDYMAQVFRREAHRLHEVDAKLDHLYNKFGAHAELKLLPGAALSPEQQHIADEIRRFEADPENWVEQQLPPETVDEAPQVDPVEPDEPATIEVGTLAWHGVTPRCVVRPADPTDIGAAIGKWPPVNIGVDRERKVPTGAYLMDLRSIRVASIQLAKTASACQDHQAAITRQLSVVPPELRKPLRRRIERTRRSCALSLERGARRMSRQSTLLRTRADTPGLVDGAFNPHLPPVGLIPVAYVKILDEVGGRAPLSEYSNYFVSVTEQLDHAMTRLVRRLPVIYGSLPPGWWKPVGYTTQTPPHAIWGNNIPAHLLAVLPAMQGARPTPVAPPVEPTDSDEPNDSDKPTDTDEPGREDQPPAEPPAPGDSHTTPAGTSGFERTGTSTGSGGRVVTARLEDTSSSADTLPDSAATEQPRRDATHGAGIRTAPVAAGGAALGVGATGGAVLASKKSRSKVSDWASYAKNKGVLSRKGVKGS